MAARVFIVEDEEDVLGVVTEYLETLGYEVYGVASGVEALRVLAEAEEPFDAAVVDWVLSDGSGREVLHRLKAAQPGCALVVTTGHGADVVGESIASSYSASILRKPFTMRALALRLRSLLPVGQSEL